jgi:hypothetical protein
LSAAATATLLTKLAYPLLLLLLLLLLLHVWPGRSHNNEGVLVPSMLIHAVNCNPPC